MKKILAIILAISLLFSFTAFAEEKEEYSNNADMDYDYNASYDETETETEITTDDYDDVDTSYNEAYDETETEEYYGDELHEDVPTYNNGGNYQQEDGITVFVNDIKVEFDVQPVLINDRTMVPVRAIFESLGAEVTWNGNTQTAKGVLDDIVVEITIGENYIVRNGEKIKIDSPAIIIDGRTLVPARAVAESYDCTVNWYGETQAVEIIR